MDFLFFLKRRRTSVDKFIKINNINSYEELLVKIKELGLKPPTEEELGYEFKKDVEERSAVKSSTKKKRVSNKKSSKPKTNDSSSSRRSRSVQRSRKSSNKPQRKSNGGKLESVQPASGSEDTK